MYEPNTVGHHLRSLLIDHGLFDAQADKVMAAVAAEGDPLSEVLGKSWDGYPRPFQAVAWMTVKAAAVDWIDNNAPKHWARGLFAPGDTAPA